MKIPDNYQVSDMFSKYGYFILFLVVIAILGYRMTINIIKAVQISSAPSCSIENIKKSNTVSYDGMLFRVETFEHNEYDWVDDTLYIRLTETK